MAVTKIHPIKTTLKKALDYIENPAKTDEKVLVSSFACSYETADILCVQRPHAVQPPRDLIDVDTNLFQFGGLRPDVGGVDVNNISVYQHLPGVCRKIPCVQQSHLLPDKFPFLRRHGNTQNNFSGSVRHSFTSFLGGLGYTPASIFAGSGYTPYACYVTSPHYYDTTTSPFCPQNSKK